MTTEQAIEVLNKTGFSVRSKGTKYRLTHHATGAGFVAWDEADLVHLAQLLGRIDAAKQAYRDLF